MRIVRLSMAGRRPERLFAMDRDRVVVLAGQDLRVLDGHGPEPRSIFHREGIQAAAMSSHARDVLFTLDREGQLVCWTFGGESFARRALVALSPRAAASCRGIAVSASGRFAAVDSNPTLLVDVERELVVAAVDATYSSRPSFQRLPGGREVLFASAPGYMDVRLVDAATGRVLALRDASSSFDFCHVAYQLALAGTRLVTFGCVWAAPYEARIYDSSAWIAAAEADAALPIPLALTMVASFEPVASNMLFPFAVPLASVEGGARPIVIASIEDPADLAPDEDGDEPSNLVLMEATAPALAAEVRAAAALGPRIMVVRCVDPADGSMVRASVHSIAAVAEGSVHHVDGDSIVLLGERLQIVHAREGRLEDLGVLGLGAGARTAVAGDGSVGFIAHP